MILHNDQDAFRVLLETIHNETGYRKDVLEKDYYVVLLLEELSKLQRDGLPAYFKGGTALYKALKTTNRFSEDIDLSVDTRNCTRTRSDKLLEKATKKYVSLERDASKGVTHRSEVIAVYNYNPVTVIDENDALQRFGNVKIEATSFTISEPVAPLEVTPMLYELADARFRNILEDTYQIKPFTVDTITLERIFIDKLFAAEAYIRNANVGNRAFEAAKHIYDLSVMKEHHKIKKFIRDDEHLRKLVMIRLEEELQRLDGIPNVLPDEFLFLKDSIHKSMVKDAYNIMQKQYVLLDKDRISFADAEKALSQGKKVLLNPEKEEINGLEGKFVQVFWSPVHFPNQPGTMGILCDPAHPALVDFPTEMHSNWQWWDICKNATTMELYSLKNNMQPIVRMVDNFYKNRNLGLLFEVKAGDGKLLVCSSDLAKNLNTRPVARQLRYSLLKYMESDKFNPQEEVAFKQIKQVLHNVNRTKEVKKSIYE